MYTIGVDIGSTYTKTCILDADKHIVSLYSEKTPVQQKNFFKKRVEELLDCYNRATIISCGYGRSNIESVKSINELIALAKGAEYLNPKYYAVLDIGGQDTKIVTQRAGRLEKFYTNDKCAAGCGMFLSNTCNLIEKEFHEIDLIRVNKPEIILSSTCAVFAQSEIVGLIADECNPDLIIQAVIWQILSQAKVLLNKVRCDGIVLSGGLSQIKGIAEYAQKALEKEVIVFDKGAYMSAIGSAIIGLELET